MPRGDGAAGHLFPALGRASLPPRQVSNPTCASRDGGPPSHMRLVEPTKTPSHYAGFLV
jgi:hypothetical protein